MMPSKAYKKIVYFSESHFQLHEVRWFRTKVGMGILGSVVLGLIVILLVNHFMYDFLGLGYNKVESLTQENRHLQQKLASISSSMKTLEDALSKLDREGNQLRLMVDLPPVDDGTKAAGIGGALPEPDWGLLHEGNAEVLRTTTSTLEKLSNEIKVQEQSYEEVLNKYNFNKGYFAALPALKPMEGFYSINQFGLRMHPVLGIFKTHTGLDIINDVGTPVVAAGDGVVEMAGQSGGGYGIVVVVNHGYGYQTLYAHLSQVFVREGQHVRRGDRLAKSGKTGLVSGPHLHYEVRFKGVCKNPVDYFFDDISSQDYRKQFVTR